MCRNVFHRHQTMACQIQVGRMWVGDVHVIRHVTRCLEPLCAGSNTLDNGTLTSLCTFKQNALRSSQIRFQAAISLGRRENPLYVTNTAQNFKILSAK